MSKDLQHIGIIMDGNRRWARAQGLSIFKGHSKGMEQPRQIVEAAIDVGISYLTLFAFSTENWKRSKEEVAGLMEVFRTMLKSTDLQELMDNNVKVSVIGYYKEFPEDIIEKIKKVEEKSKNNTGIHVLIALGYGGRDELVRGVQKLIDQGEKIITEESIKNTLYTKDIPDPDLIIRTGGEQRTSGFLLFQAAYAELYFTDVYWPDFTKEEFKKAVAWYQDRERRFGK